MSKKWTKEEKIEILDLYDVNRIKTKRTMIRGEKVPDNHYRLIVKIAIINDQDQMLIQKICKKMNYTAMGLNWNGKWDISVSGSATSGDNSSQAATRELKDEIGFEYDFTNHRPSFTFNSYDSFIDCYIINVNNINLNDLVLQKSEVEEVKWASKSEILGLIEKKEFVLWKKEIIELFFKKDAHEGVLDIKKREVLNGIYEY